MKGKDLTGQRFGRLIVIKCIGRSKRNYSDEIVLRKGKIISRDQRGRFERCTETNAS